jgi:hypothetical protein
MSNEPLEELLNKMPDESAGEEEIAAYMNQFMATAGGPDMLKTFADQITAGGSLDAMLQEEESRYPKLQSPARLIFLIELTGTEPLVWRRVSLPADASFFDLHCTLQDAFGWQDSHAHLFEIWEGGQLELTFSPDTGEEADENDYCEVGNRIIDLFNEGITEFQYLYDLDKEWRHRIVVVDVAEAGEKGTSKEFTAQLHDGAGHGPPEDCEGVGGFQKFLKGEHQLCENYEPDILEKFREGKPDLSSITFREPATVLRS